MKHSIIELQRVIGYEFNDIKLLEKALTHSSYANERKMKKTDSNERMEFLGDAVLELVMSEYLFCEMNNMQEGELTRKRASMVCESTLDLCAREIGLEKYILLGKGEELTGGRKRPSIISDAFEALIGGIYLDGGFTNAKEFIRKFVIEGIDEKTLFFDSKTILQEMIQAKQMGKIEYKLTNESGPDHDKEFEVELYINEEKVSTGKGHTKKNAQQRAAYKAILRLRQLEQ